ncbi:MAG: alpha-galactosidase [Eubacterium sp.]|nr:alpha-galactosidase [Eubacterium sp.]
MIKKKNDLIILHTEHTSYVMRVLPSGHVEHLYYGKRIHVSRGESALFEKHEFPPGDTSVYSDEHKKYSLNDMRLEMSSYGKGDHREPFIEASDANGSLTLDFTYDSTLVKSGKVQMETLPGSYGDNSEVDTLTIYLRDLQRDMTLELHYHVYEKRDVITRRAVLVNEGEKSVHLLRLMSCQIDFDPGDYTFHTFTGAWTREMMRNDNPVISGSYVNSSFTGTSSNAANPFVMLSRDKADENHGEVYGFNLIYSGNHFESVSVSSYDKVRFLQGINPAGFDITVNPGERFESPEMVMTYSDSGFNGMSQNMHAFVKKHIVRGYWRDRPRPVVLNSWEANYFNIDERKLTRLAEAGADAGIELFVMDDGWFGDRNDDTSGLGDWKVNRKKLPGGLKSLADKMKALGLDFGIWLEPEMVNVNSDLYREHPDWTLDIPGQPHSEGRNQRILDFTRKDVQDHIINAVGNVLASADIAYVKWDMNRNFTDYFSRKLSDQGEVMHRYQVGLYRVMKTLTERFPKVLFEGCASGGNRFDLGILCYFPQIWASDDTDGLMRAYIQTGYSYGYPMSVISAHVSEVPNHQTIRRTPYVTRLNIASFGCFGYELNLSDLNQARRKSIKKDIEEYKKWRDVFFYGSFFRGKNIADSNEMEWTVVSPDRKKAVGLYMQKLVIPNTGNSVFRAKGLDEKTVYHFYGKSYKIDVKDFGSLINTMAPIHIKQDSAMHNVIARAVKMYEKPEDYEVYGDTLMHAGVHLRQAFTGTGWNEEMRFFTDFSSRIYYMEAISNE